MAARLRDHYSIRFLGKNGMTEILHRLEEKYYSFLINDYIIIIFTVLRLLCP